MLRDSDCTTTHTKSPHCKCLHTSASVQRFPPACSECLRSRVSILVSARRGLSLLAAHRTRLSGSATVFFSPCHLPFASENQQGNASNHLSCKHTEPPAFGVSCTRRSFASVSLKRATRQAARLPLLGTSTLQSFHQKMTSFCLSLLFVSLSTSIFSSFFPLPSSERIEEIPWYIIIRNV